MSSKLLFSYEKDVMLAEVVSNHPCLFDLKHQAYKDIQIRENVWKEISINLKKVVSTFIQIHFHNIITL